MQHYATLQLKDALTGIGAAIVNTSLTATSANISWSPQPAQFHLPVHSYTVLITQVTGSGQALCTQVMDSRPAVITTDTSMSFPGLEEFSTYTVTVTSIFYGFGIILAPAASEDFTTLSTGRYCTCNFLKLDAVCVAPTGALGTVTPSVTSRNIMVTWDTIECIERNGIITGYTVVFQEQGGANVSGNTVDRTFSAGGLTPGTNYTFQVAGVNDAGTGPFTDITTITTDEEG